MAVRGFEWIAHPEGRTFFEPTTLNIGLYTVAIIALLSITFMYLLLNFHRLAEELQDERRNIPFWRFPDDESDGDDDDENGCQGDDE